MAEIAPQFLATHNLKAVVLAYQDLPDKLVNQAAVRALNQMATTVRAEAARRIGRQYNMKVSTAKNQMVISRATRDSLTASIVVSGRPIPLIEFDARKTWAGVTVKIKGSRKLVRHAFIATMKSGHVGVYERLARGKGSGRLPIEQLFSLSLPAAFTQKEIMDALKQVATERFGETMRQQMRFVLLKAA